MRLIVSALACVAVGGLSVALAEPPNDSAAAVPAAAIPAAATPAAAAPSAAAPAAVPAAAAPAPAGAIPSGVTITGARPVPPAAPDLSLDEKHFLAEGYKLEMRHGEKVFCRREETLGTRLGSEKVCSSVIQLKATEQQAKASVDRSMMQQNNPSNNPTMGK